MDETAGGVDEAVSVAVEGDGAWAGKAIWVECWVFLLRFSGGGVMILLVFFFLCSGG